MSALKIQTTKDYRLFTRNAENRQVDDAKHRRLKESMEKYGFLPYFPIVVRRVNNKLMIVDGQHRAKFAELLGLPIYYVEAHDDFDIATINDTPVTWKPRDFAMVFAASGKADYTEGLEFANAHKLPIGTAFTLLAGTTSFSNIKDRFHLGTFQIKDRSWAEAVAAIYVPINALNRKIKGARFIEACMAVCRVKGFDQKRLIQGANNCREKLISYATKDGYLEMLEYLYNYRRSQMVGLKVQAIMAMRERNPSGSKDGPKKRRTG